MLVCFNFVLVAVWLIVIFISSSWYHGGLVCNFGISWLYSLAVLVRVGIRPAISTPQSRTLSTRQRRFSYLAVFCVSSSWYRGGLVCDYGISWSYSLAVLVRVGIRPAISTPQSRTLSTRQRRFSYLVVFCVSSSLNHGGLVCDNGISWSYSLAVLVRVGIKPAIFRNSVKNSNH